MNVTGIKTYSNSFLVVYKGDDVAQVFKSRANYVATACHGFENRLNGLGGCMGSIESLGYASDSGGSGVAASPAGVEVVEPDTKRFAAIEIVEEGIVGLSGLLRIFLGEIDEIRAVR